MKKASTWYLLILAVLNALLAQGTSYSATLWASGYQATLGDNTAHVFAATQQYLHFWWWPYLFVGIAFILALISIFSCRPSSVFYHCIIIMMIVECFILFAAQIAFVLPLIGTHY
jgi:hypothetical protein